MPESRPHFGSIIDLIREGIARSRGAADSTGRLRYGVPTSEKERLAASRSLPGAPDDRTADQAAANRYAAGYLFNEHRPEDAEEILPWITRLKLMGIPGISSTPEEQSFAHAGANRAKIERENRLRAAVGGLIESP